MGQNIFCNKLHYKLCLCGPIYNLHPYIWIPILFKTQMYYPMYIPRVLDFWLRWNINTCSATSTQEQFPSGVSSPKAPSWFWELWKSFCRSSRLVRNWSLSMSAEIWRYAQRLIFSSRFPRLQIFWPFWYAMAPETDSSNVWAPKMCRGCALNGNPVNGS